MIIDYKFLNWKSFFETRIGDELLIFGQADVNHIKRGYFCAALDAFDTDDEPIQLVFSQCRQTVLDAFSEMIQAQTRKVCDHFLLLESSGIYSPLYHFWNCRKLNYREPMLGKVMVLWAENVKTDYKTGADQLFLCINDPKTSENGVGKFISLYSGDYQYIDPSDLYGTLDDAKLPTWARLTAQSLREKYLGGTI